jgi:hypothetical protein
MAGEGSGLAKPMAWWGTIQGAVEKGATTAQVWDAIRSFGEANNLAWPSDIFQQVNTIRGQAAALRNASTRLGQAAPSDAITGSMLAPLPYARSSVEQSLASQYHVRVGYTARQGTETDTAYVTLAYNQLPATVGELQADAQVIAGGTAESYNGELISLDTIEIGAW